MKVIVFGASENPARYSNKAIRDLRRHGHDVTAIGRRAGQVVDVPIVTTLPESLQAHTATIYLGEANQTGLEEQLQKGAVQRVIFNPGAENPALNAKLTERNVEVLEACTLVMLATGQF